MEMREPDALLALDRIGQLISVIRLSRKMSGQRGSGLSHAGQNRGSEIPLLQQLLHGLAEIGPERRAAMFVYTEVANHGELPRCGSEEKENAVAMFGAGHPEPFESLLRMTQSLGAGGWTLS